MNSIFVILPQALEGRFSEEAVRRGFLRIEETGEGSRGRGGRALSFAGEPE
jgi:hypothetical protein